MLVELEDLETDIVLWSQATDLTEDVFKMEDCPEPTDLLEELLDVRVGGMGLLFKSRFFSVDDSFTRDNPEDVFLISVSAE